MLREKFTGFNPRTPAGRRRFLLLSVGLILSLVIILGMTILGGIWGYRVALAEIQRDQVASRVQSIAEQYALAVQDMDAGRFDFARQRFEYVLAKDPAFPGASDGLSRVMAVLYATATPTPLPASPTPTPTRDLRPVEEIYNQLLTNFAQTEWNRVIDLVIALRQADSSFRVAEVDGMLYRTLRYRGIARILEQGDLEGGIYDLSLAEAFGPLDVDALTYRDLARYYGMGSGFWEVYPEQAVYYFGLVASALPSLHDASGWTASERYYASIVQFGDQLARDGEWCSAQEQYELALSYSPNGDIQATAEHAAHECAPPTETPEPETATPEFTLTPSSTIVIPGSNTPTPTTVVTTVTVPSSTAEQTTTVSPSTTPEMTPTPPAPSDTPPPTVSPNPTETLPSPATDTPAPSDTPGVPTETITTTTESLPSATTEANSGVLPH